MDGDVPRRASYGVFISQIIRFARVCNHITDINARNKCLTAKLLQQGYRYHKLRKTFSKFYRRHYELITEYNVGLKTLLSEGLSEPEIYGDLVYKFKKLKGINDFSFQFRKIITRYRRIGYNLNVMRQSACLVFDPIMVDNYAAFFNCTPVGRDGPDLRLYSQPTLEAYSTQTHSDNLISHSCERITVRFGMHMSHSHSNSTQISSKR